MATFNSKRISTNCVCQFIQRTVACMIMFACCSVVVMAQTGSDDVDVRTIDQHSRAYRQGEVIVKFKQSTTLKVRRNSAGRFLSAGKSSVDATLQSIGVNVMNQLMPITGAKTTAQKLRSLHGDEVKVADLSQLYCLKFDAAKTASVYDAIEKLNTLDDVEYAEPNYLVYTLDTGDRLKYSTDPLYLKQWGPAAINLDQLWSIQSISDECPVIAILDTGVDITHPDLKDNIWTNSAESEGAEGQDDDGNGFADDVNGWDFVNQSARMRDNNGHGTHCAGIAAACGGNGIGIVGANPDALIMPITVMQSDGTGDVATIIKGIDYAVANGADIISMSFGGYTYSIAEEQALARAYASAVLVAAAGNDGMCVYPRNHCLFDATMYPAAFTFVFGVQASTSDGVRAGFSNFDPDGPIYFNPEAVSEEQMYNYELMAPGVGIYSTYPGGNYRSLSGTSMACPLAAGAISRLLQCKEYASKELLFGDLINTRKGDDLEGNIDILAAYKISDDDRLPNLSLVSYSLQDSIDGDGDGRADAGETIEIYPILRNAWGQAKNIKVWIELGANEDSEIAEILTDKVDFGSELSSYAKGTSKNPIKIKINSDCVDGRNICFTLRATCDNNTEELYYDFTLTVENGVEIGGMIEKDMTLYPDVHYIVTKSLAIPEGVTLTIKPGTVLKFKDGTGLTCASNGHVNAIGTPDSLITFTKTDLGVGSMAGLRFDCFDDTLEYISIKNFVFDTLDETDIIEGNFKNSRIEYCDFYAGYVKGQIGSGNFRKCDIINCFSEFFHLHNCSVDSLNFINNQIERSDPDYVITGHSIYLFSGGNNIIANSIGDKNAKIIMAAEDYYGSSSNVAKIYRSDSPSYYGSSREDIVREGVWDIESNYGFSKFNLSNMLTQPNPNAHGIVWKVVVNGYDAQDEFEQLPPLGVGRHKFEVYYSKPISKDVAPTIAMGVRPPYTQTSIAEDGSWNDDGDIYTAYVTITGKMAIDGLNRIYVSGGEDLEHFEIPLENTRFNVNVSAAGSMSVGFEAEAGLGKVDLTWKEQDENVDDILGYNLYRYQIVNDSTVSDTIRINESLLNDTTYTDYDVTHGITYCYYYKIMRTDLSENSPSSTVAVTPLTATKGDANGSMAVDVADVVTEIGYLTNQDPKPFIFDAADVNSDSTVNILDVVGTINIIITPTSASSIASLSDEAVTYTIEDGVLYLDSPVELGGVQCSFTVDGDADITPTEALDGFETVGQLTDTNKYLFLAYSMSGKTLSAGRYALLNVGSAQLSQIVLSDTKGKNVVAVNGQATGIGAVVKAQMNLPYPNPFVDEVTIPYVIGKNGSHSVRIVISDISGRSFHSYATTCGYGDYSYTWHSASSLTTGVYLCTLYVDGMQVQTSKIVKK